MKKQLKEKEKRTICSPLAFIMSIKTDPNRIRYRSASYQYGCFKGKGTGCF